MPDLIAQGPSGSDRWRRELPDPTSGTDVFLGRLESDWNVPWDGMVSRKHVRLVPLANGSLEVHGMMTARNAIFHNGHQSHRFTLVPGDHFVIGKTTFTLVNRPGASESAAIGELTRHAYDHAALRKRNFRDAASRIEMLSRLPDLITGSVSDEELLVRVTNVLLQATPNATAVAVVQLEDTAPSSQQDSPAPLPVKILHYDSRVPDRDESRHRENEHHGRKEEGARYEGPSVSARLARDAIRKRESILHLWTEEPPSLKTSAKGGASSHGVSSHGASFTASEEVDWAFCVPLRSDACPGWALYVAGALSPEVPMDREQSLQAAPENLQDDVKFTELVGTTIANLRQSHRLQRRQSEMRHFFAPVVLDALARQDTDEVLAPRETDLSIMFCDLRGFSRRSEQDSTNMLQLLSEVSDALGVMTRHILDSRGVIGDFHGDAAMGFWGWPLPQKDSAAEAVKAASRIRDDYQRKGDVAGFRCGIGVATGRAVAGRIGTVDQVKITAFGPVVNLASRLEGMTKVFGVNVILDAATVDAVQSCESADFHFRRLGNVRPAGFEKTCNVFELLPESPEHPEAREASGFRCLSKSQIQAFESSLDALEQGNWEDAYEQLHQLPSWDRPKDVLISLILKHNRKPPSAWDGTVLGW